jgi:hypothetical protein
MKKTNQKYGGLNYKGTRVLFTNGEFDMYRVLGFYNRQPNAYTRSLLIKGAGMSADVLSVKDSDSVEVKKARTYTQALIGEWLNQV